MVQKLVPLRSKKSAREGGLTKVSSRLIVLVLFALTLNGCAIAQFYRDSEFHRDRAFYRQYRPPVEVNDRQFGSPVTEQPDRIQLINGDGFAYRPRGQRRKVNLSLASYFLPSDSSPFAAPARVSSIEYLYCSLGARPGHCGTRIVYESEELHPADVLSTIRKTNHEWIIDALVAKHGQPQISAGTEWAGPNTKTEKLTQVFTEEPSGAITRSASERDQHRVWCDFSKGVPRKCQRSIIATFQPSMGRGVIIYIDEDLYRYARMFETAWRHQHPTMKIIKGRPRFRQGLRPLETMAPAEQKWWVRRLSKASPHRFLAWEQLPTEIDLELKAKASGRPREQIARKMTQEEFQREWVTAWVGMESGPSVARPYWYGYLEALVARDFSHRSQLSDEAHIKWTVTSRQIPSTATFVGDGYIHGLDGIRNPRYGDSSMPNFSWGKGEFNCCEDTGMSLWRKLGGH